LVLPIRDESVDLVVSFETFEHLPEPESFLDEARRVLVPGGRLVCSTPDRTVYSPGHEPHSIPWNRYHAREYSHAEFAAALARQFRNCQHFGQNPIGLRRARLMTALGRALPGNTAVRLNQATKLTRFRTHDLECYRVEPLRPDRAYEITIAVCER
jgi:SAM-dependent methyltransferase